MVDRILSGCDGVHVQMTGFLASFASHSTDKGQGIPKISSVTFVDLSSNINVWYVWF